MHADNYTYTITEQFFQIQKGKTNTPEEFDKTLDNYNNFKI